LGRLAAFVRLPMIRAFLIACFFGSSNLGFCQDPCSCGGTDVGVGPSFVVHGRLKSWNGTPSLRISVLGTKRILGVHGDSPIPHNLESFVKTFETQVIGDFVVCPLTKSRPGWMQIVCIKSATNLRVLHVQ
jgi:hypothetical protein